MISHGGRITEVKTMRGLQGSKAVLAYVACEMTDTREHYENACYVVFEQPECDVCVGDYAEQRVNGAWSEFRLNGGPWTLAFPSVKALLQTTREPGN